MFILGLIAGLILAALNVILFYLFRTEIRTFVNKVPLKEKADFIETEDAIDHVKKMLQ